MTSVRARRAVSDCRQQEDRPTLTTPCGTIAEPSCWLLLVTLDTVPQGVAPSWSGCSFAYARLRLPLPLHAAWIEMGLERQPDRPPAARAVQAAVRSSAPGLRPRATTPGQVRACTPA